MILIYQQNFTATASPVQSNDPLTNTPTVLFLLFSVRRKHWCYVKRSGVMVGAAELRADRGEDKEK